MKQVPVNQKGESRVTTRRSWAWVSGECRPLETSALPLTYCGFQYGMSLFETILCVSGHAVSLERHISRLVQSSRELFLQPPDPIALRSICQSLLEHLHSIECRDAGSNFAKLKIFLSASDRADDPKKPDPSCVLAIIEPIDASLVGACKKVRLKLTPEPRSDWLVKHKSTNYWPSYLALRDARSMGFDDVLFYDLSQRIVESHASSILWTEREVPGVIFCQSNEILSLPSVSVSRILDRWRETGGEVRTGTIWIESLSKNVESLVLTSSIQMVRPVDSIEDCTFDLVRGLELAQRLNEILKEDWSC